MQAAALLFVRWLYGVVVNLGHDDFGFPGGAERKFPAPAAVCIFTLNHMAPSSSVPSTTSSAAVFLAAGLAASLVVSVTTAFVALRRHKKNSKSSTNSNDSSSLSYPPTPPTRHWLFKHGGHIDLTKCANHDVLFLDWQDKLSSKVVMFELPVIGRLISVGDAAVAKYVLHNHPTKSPTYEIIFPLIGTKSLVTMQGDEWSAQRRMYNPGFSPDFLKGIVGTIAAKCERMLDRCDVDIDRGHSTNMLARAVDLTIDVIVTVGFGEDWYDGSNEGKRRVNTVRDLTLLVGAAMKSPLKRYFDPSHIWKTYRLSRALDRDMKELVQKRLDEFNSSSSNTTTSSTSSTSSSDLIPSEQKDILSLTLLRVLQSNEKKMTNSSKNENDIVSCIKFDHEDMENVTSQLKTFYFAGHDTTATTIAWAYWLLIQHPEELDRARLEVATHVGPFPRDCTYERLQKCDFLDAVARETLRLYPPAASTRYVSSSSPPSGTTSSSSSDPLPPNAGGYLLRDSVVHVNFYAIQRDPDYWYEPNKFIPSRFLGDKGKERIASSYFLPFSKGTRDCIGKYFALLEIKIALAALITKYDGSAVSTEEEYVARLTSIPKHGCMVNLGRRK